MPSNAAAVWSAVAATFAALSSFLIMRIQRRNLIESVRPEVVLTGWSRGSEGEGETAHETIGFKTIRNVGKGVALHLTVQCIQKSVNKPTVVLATTRLPILAANESMDVHASALIWWKNVDGDHLHIPITAVCWDSRDTRHETVYHLLAVRLSAAAALAEEIAPGVMLAGRATRYREKWLLTLSGRLTKAVDSMRRKRAEAVDAIRHRRPLTGLLSRRR